MPLAQGRGYVAILAGPQAVDRSGCVVDRKQSQFVGEVGRSAPGDRGGDLVAPSAGRAQALLGVAAEILGAARELGLNCLLRRPAAALGQPLVQPRGVDGPAQIILIPVGDQARMHIRLDNRGNHSADMLVISAYFRGVAFDREFDTRINDWRVVDAVEGHGATAAEWSGGAALHGRTSRRLPVLDTGSLIQFGDDNDCSLEILVASNDYLRRVTVPFRFINARQPVPAKPAEERLPEWM